MAITRALIVDDSRTAQHRLKKLLMRYSLEVDTATSAEEALGYLTYRMPSVIFMDHHMEGMDGFEALKIIKANPTTATIPVIMYTSKSDDVYAGQAHALGALDTLSKSLMKPSRIEEVLSKLNIFPGQAVQAPENPGFSGSETGEMKAITDTQEVAPASGAPQVIGERRSKAGASELKAQIARLFELHIADVRSQITENTKFIVRRLTTEIKNAANEEPRVEDVPISVLNEETRAETNKMGIMSNALSCLILIALAAISFQVFQSQRQIDKLNESYTNLADLAYQDNLLLDDVVANGRTVSPEGPKTLNKAKLLNTIGWAASIDLHFDYDEEPLNDTQIVNLQTLTFKLHDAGFRGFVELNIHLGNFCLIQIEGGDWVLPPAKTPLSKCTFLQDQKLDLSAENYANVAYMQFEQSTVPIQNGDIEFIINVSAFENPIFAYPEPRSTILAGDWNKIAAKNQQIVLLMETSE